MPDPFAELTNLLSQNAMKLTEAMRLPLMAPIAVGGALFQGGQTVVKGGPALSPAELMKRTAMALDAASPLKLLKVGSEIVGEEKKTMAGNSTRTTIF